MWGPGSNRGLVSRAVGLAGLQLLQRECHLGGGKQEGESHAANNRCMLVVIVRCKVAYTRCYDNTSIYFVQ